MLLHPAVAEQSSVYVSCSVRSPSAAEGGGSARQRSSTPAEGGWDGFPGGPIRRLLPATATWAQEGTD
eukprot:9581128-Alexandrium_andersonii.AAC.1